MLISCTQCNKFFENIVHKNNYVCCHCKKTDKNTSKSYDYGMSPYKLTHKEKNGLIYLTRQHTANNYKNNVIKTYYGYKKTNKHKLTDFLYKYLKAYYRYKRKDAFKRHINFNISFKEWINWYINYKNVCAYCKISISKYNFIRKFILNYRGSDSYVHTLIKPYKQTCFNTSLHPWITNHHSMTIDRIDNTQGYTINNITKSCWMCNNKKSTQPVLWLNTDQWHKDHFKLHRTLLKLHRNLLKLHCTSTSNVNVLSF